jgi:hypothetical protein
MKLFSLIFISAALGLTISILLFKLWKIDIQPLFIGLAINCIGYYIFRKELDHEY